MPKGVKETRKVKSDQIPDQAQEWKPSLVRDEDLQLLVDRGFLPPKELAQWKSAYQSPFPTINPSETIVYASFCERGLGLPTSKFFRQVLDFYQIELVNLNPNGLSQIAFFVHMCEAFLGIEPHFQLFRYFFRLKPHPNKENTNICGGAGFQVRQDKKHEYFGYTLKDPKRTWRDERFIIGNKAPQLPECTLRKPVYSGLWNKSPNDCESIMIPQLVEMIADLKRKGLTGIGICYSFIKRRIQPLQERPELGYKYKGREDPSRLKEDLTHDEILERLQIFSDPVNFKPKIPLEYSAGNSPPPEHIASYCSPAPLPGHLTADQTENRVQAAAIREEEARGKGLAHQSDSEEPAEEELQVQVRKIRVPQVATSKSTRIPNLPDAEPAYASAPPQPEPAASSTETHPEATLVEKVGITEAKDELTQMLATSKSTCLPDPPGVLPAPASAPSQPESAAPSTETHPEVTLGEQVGITEGEDELNQMLEAQEKLIDSIKIKQNSELLKKVTNCKSLLENTQNQLDQALQREEIEKQGRMENNSNSRQPPPPPPGYPTAAGAEQQQQGGRKQGRQGKATSRGEKGCIAVLCCCCICEMCCD